MKKKKMKRRKKKKEKFFFFAKFIRTNFSYFGLDLSFVSEENHRGKRRGKDGEEKKEEREIEKRLSCSIF